MKAQTNSETVEFSIRDVIRTVKKNAKAIKTLENVGGNKPGIKEAIAAIEAENEKVKQYAQAAVLKQIELAIKDA